MSELNNFLKYSDDRYDNEPDKKNLIRTTVDDYYSLKMNQYSNYKWYEINTGKDYGDLMESQIIKSFFNLVKHKEDDSYDADGLNRAFGMTVEIKSSRLAKAIKPKTPIDEVPSLTSRIINEEDVMKEKFNSSFQQVKPSKTQWFLLHVLYGNSDVLYAIPSFMVSGKTGRENKEVGKFTLSKQHREHETEGQINLTKGFLREASMYKIDGYSYLKEGSYDFAEIAKTILNRLKEKNIHIPENYLIKLENIG